MNYLEVDGVDGEGFDKGKHGFKVVSTNSVENSCAVSIGHDVGASHLRFKHISFQSPTHGNGNGVRVFWVNSPSSHDVTFQNCSFLGERVALALSASDYLIDHCYFKDVGSTDSALHSEVIGFNGNDLTIRYSIFENMWGTANTTYIEPLGTNTQGVYIYGNVFKSTSVNESTGKGIFAITSSDIATDVKIYNNTIYGLNGTSGVYGGNVPGSEVEVFNNIWQNCAKPPVFAQCIEGYNIKNTGGIPFINPEEVNFHLSSSTEAGTALASPYNIDANGQSRGVEGLWHIGAYEYIKNAPPQTPTGLNIQK